MRTRWEILLEKEEDSNPTTTTLSLPEDMDDDAAYGGQGLALYRGYFVMPLIPYVFNSEAEVDEYLALKAAQE